MSQLFEAPPISLIPESAPFTSEQRAWLNGFLAGWTGISSETAATALTEVTETPVEADEEFPWHDPAMPLDDRLELAKEKPLPRRLMAAMAQLDCGACGYVCKTYAEKLASGEETCLTLCSPGGKDTAKALKRLLKEHGTIETAASGSTPKSNSHAAISKWSRQNPYPATVLRTVNLNGPASDKQTMHVELDLGDSGLVYDVGDSLGVYPTNCDELVTQLLEQLGMTGDELVSLRDETIPVAEALTRRLCLSEITEELLECLACSADQDEGHALRSLIEDDGLFNGCDVLDLLRLFPTARPIAEAFANALSPLRPRLYSISSSPTAHPGQVHLTVGRVAWEHNGRVRKGVASTLFADRLSVGQTVRVFVQKSHGFALPSDPGTPIIMIGPGTGIAPFRAFLEERAATGATGRNWLFFGDRREATDFLYRDELHSWQRSGVLTRLDLAFSRDGATKTYVQTRMRENAAELWRWLEDGAAVFVCGDAKRMAADVDRTLCEIVGQQGGRNPAAAREYIEQLAKAGRYKRDVY